MNITQAGHDVVTPERAAYLVLRAARCQRRLILSIVLLAFSVATWSYRLIPGFAYPWWYATVPTALLLGVLVLGRLAARQMKASDAAYCGGNIESYTAYEGSAYEYSDREYTDREAAAVYLNGQPVPATQMIPEADLRLAVINSLKDDPELETRRHKYEVAC